MNIGFVVHHYDPADGTGGYAVELVTRLAREHQVTLYAAAVRGPVPEGVRVVRVPALGGTAYARILTFPLAFMARRQPHDVVHAQGWVTNDADVVTTHIVLAAWRKAARQAAVVAPPGERILGRFVIGRELALVRRCRAVIAPSRRAANDVALFYDRVAGVSVVHHGFPPARALGDRAAARARFGLPADRLVAVYAGDARKGFDAAARALAGAPGVWLLVASRSRPAPYLDRARQLGVADRVTWAGGLDDASEAYAAADVLLHPTIYDTFAMVVAEAMAWGLPVIVSREAGIAELVVHRDSGWILGPDRGDASAALLALRDDPALRARLAEGGRLVALSRTWDDVARETVAVYTAVAGGTR